MTNAQKYLKDGVVAKELWKTFQVYYYKNKNKESDVEKAFRSFFEQETKPTLTEDERVILRNMIPQAKTIERDTDGELIIKICSDTIAEDFCYSGAFIYDHLFQFIKPRRRIFY